MHPHILFPQVYLAEVVDAGAGELCVRGASMEPLVGRVLVNWGRGNVLSHQLLMVCLETRPDSSGPVSCCKGDT